MKLGIIADIHGDLDALKASMVLLNREQVNQIICAGDLVEKGPQNEEVIKTIRYYKVPCVQGNHDLDCIGNQEWLKENAVSDHPNILTSDAVTYLESLPTVLRTTIEGVSIYMAHGTPWSAYTYVYSYSPQDVFERIVRESEADITIIGHSHEPMAAIVNGKAVINPGSLAGKHTEGSRTCGVLSLPDGAWQVFSLETGTEIEFPKVFFE